MGAWVETVYIVLRGHRRYVAPYVGAWVETPVLAVKAFLKEVAPYVGAWVETLTRKKSPKWFESHLTWVRGLKPRENQIA